MPCPYLSLTHTCTDAYAFISMRPIQDDFSSCHFTAGDCKGKAHTDTDTHTDTNTHTHTDTHTNTAPLGRYQICINYFCEAWCGCRCLTAIIHPQTFNQGSSGAPLVPPPHPPVTLLCHPCQDGGGVTALEADLLAVCNLPWHLPDKKHYPCFVIVAEHIIATCKSTLAEKKNLISCLCVCIIVM